MLYCEIYKRNERLSLKLHNNNGISKRKPCPFLHFAVIVLPLKISCRLYVFKNPILNPDLWLSSDGRKTLLAPLFQRQPVSFSNEFLKYFSHCDYWGGMCSM